MNKQSTILIVENNPSLLSAAQCGLEQIGYETISAPNGETALRLAQEHKPDLMLLDVNLPGIDGFEVYRRIKADPELAIMKVLMVSGMRPDAGGEVEGLEISADDHMLRPISIRELKARIRALLRTRAAEHAVKVLAAHWQATFNAVSDAILLTDADFMILQCNRAAAEMFHARPTEIVGQKCYKVVHGTEAAVPACPMLRGGDTKRRETLAFAWAGHWLEALVDPMLDDNGIFLGAEHIIVDITERKRAEATRRENRKK